MPEPAFFDPSASPDHPRLAAAEAGVDVLILTALQDELEAVLALGEGGRSGWTQEHDREGFRRYRRAFASDRGGALRVAAAWTGEMGDRAAAIRGQQLLAELDPACLAMCGICAGDRKKVALGDVIVADRLYAYDEGKSVAEAGELPAMFHELRTFDLEATWKMDASYLAREFDLAALAAARPPSKDAQRRWILRALLAHEAEGAEAPAAHADRARCCPGWTDQVRAAVKEGVVSLKGKRLTLTDVGREWAEADHVLHPDGPPADRELRIHVGAIATGHSVQEDPGLFERLRRLVRTTIGVEMEGVGIADVARRFERRSILIKAVSDHADHEKDDSYRHFACRASAEVLLAFLLKHVEPAAPRGAERRRAGEDEISVEELIDLRGGGDRRDTFLARVERVARLREPSVSITRRRAPAPFAGVLEVAAREGAVVDLRIIGAVDQPISEELLNRYQAEVERSFRDQDPYMRSTLIHTGPQAPAGLAQQAMKRGVIVKSFSEYQGLIDFSRYLQWQTSRLEVDPVYPPSLYVDAPARWSLSGMREEKATEDALGTLRELLESPNRRFALVLGDFGAGKTFLLHELARRMGKEGGPLIPVLVEMSRLEKQRELKALLAQHFAMADMGFNPDVFQYMLSEGRIALLFDGFDELALRVTYDRALDHFETVLAAAQGEAKVVVSSRTQHFLTDKQVQRELARRAEQVGGYRLIRLDRFGEPQIRRFLGNLIADPKEAEDRYALIRDVKDLLGLSHNPRMLGFIAQIEAEKLREARKGGEITAAKLYEVLIDQWLDFEHARAHKDVTEKGISRAKLAELVTALAGLFWERSAKGLLLGDFCHLLVAEEIEAKVVEHMMGSGSLLVRDGEGRFSFVHRSVMEWLVAKTAAKTLVEVGDAAALGHDEMSELMADFLISLAGRERAEHWAWDKVKRGGEGTEKKNAARVLRRVEVIAGGPEGSVIEVPVTVDLEGQDLRGQDWSGVDWQGAGLARVNLAGASLRGADLRGADLRGANLRRADMEGARLEGADWTGADAGFARLMGANLTGAKGLSAGQMRGAKLVGAVGIEGDAGGWEPMGAGWSPVCTALAWSRDGDLLASGHRDGLIRLWDVVTGQVIRVIRAHLREIRSMAFSADGATLASASEDRMVRLWYVATGCERRAYENIDGTSITFGPDGELLAARAFGQTVELWDVATGHVMARYEGHSANVRHVTFSSDGKTLVSVSERVILVSEMVSLFLWDVDGARLLATYGVTAEHLSCVAVGTGGQVFALVREGQDMSLWDVAAGRTLLMSENNRFFDSIAISSDGRMLALGQYDSKVQLWDVAAGCLSRALGSYALPIRSVALSPDGKTLASSLFGMMMRVRDVSVGHVLRTFEGPRGVVVCVAFNPDGRTLAAGTYDKTVQFWDVATGHALQTCEGHDDPVRSVVFSPDGRKLASATDQIVYLWDADTGRRLHACEGHVNSIGGVAFSPDGRTLASGADDETSRVWDVATGQMLRIYDKQEGMIPCVAFSPDGHAIASGSFDGTIHLWSFATGRTIHICERHRAEVTAVVFTPDGQNLISGSGDTTIHLWSTTTYKSLHTLAGHTGGITGLSLSADGRLLASSSRDGTVRLWSLAARRCLAVYLDTKEGWAAYTPDGRYKMSGDIAGAFWHVAGLARYEPGELDTYVPGLRIPDDEPLFTLPPDEPR